MPDYTGIMHTVIANEPVHDKAVIIPSPFGIWLQQVFFKKMF
jgi:hypothetical protein